MEKRKRERKGAEAVVLTRKDDPKPHEGSDQEKSSRSKPEQALAEVTSSDTVRSFGIGLIVGIALAIAFTLFIVQNTHTVSFDWLFLDFSMALWIALFASFAVGFASYPLLVFELHRLKERRQRRRRATQRVRDAIREER